MFRTVGAVAFGVVGDRYGRRWGFVVNNGLFVVLELVSYFFFRPRGVVLGWEAAGRDQTGWYRRGVVVVWFGGGRGGGRGLECLDWVWARMLKYAQRDFSGTKGIIMFRNMYSLIRS